MAGLSLRSTPLPLQTEAEENFTLMVASIGSGVIPPRSRRLIGDSIRLPIRAVPRWGTTTVEWPGNIASASLTRASPTRLVISMGGVEVEVELRQWPIITGGRRRGTRWRFLCPQCGVSRDALHFIDGAWGCRGKNCLIPDGLGYPSRHRQRFCPSIARRERLRRKLIRARPGSLKARRLREMIAQQEAAMLANVRQVNSDLRKRSKRYDRHGPE